MRTLVRMQKLIYHLTALENMESIFRNGLLARTAIKTTFIDIADQTIIEKRRELGILNCVPFHLFFQNPFDGRVQKDNMDKIFVYIAIWRSLATEKRYRIIPRHPLACDDGEIYQFEEGMRAIEWDVLERREYRDDYCRNVCMAECLGPETIPVSDFAFIYTKNETDKKYLTDVALNTIGVYTFGIEVRPHYFVK